MIDGKKIYGKADLTEVIASIPPDPDSEALHRAKIIFKTSTIRVVVVTMLEGGELQEHTAPGPITIHALEGTIDVSVEGESNILEAGGIIALAPGVRHAVRCLKQGNFLLTIGIFLREPDRGGHHEEIEDHDRFLERQ